MVKKAGRPKGSKNHVAEHARKTIASVMRKNFTAEKMEKLINKIETEEGAKQAFACYMAMAEYTLPKLARVEHTGKDGSELSIEHVLNGLTKSPSATLLPEPDKSDVLDGNYEILMAEEIE